MLKRPMRVSLTMFGRGHAAEHGVALCHGGPGSRRMNRLRMLLHEQHRRDDDVGLRDRRRGNAAEPPDRSIRRRHGMKDRARECRSRGRGARDPPRPPRWLSSVTMTKRRTRAFSGRSGLWLHRACLPLSVVNPRSRAKVSVFPRARPRTKNGIFLSSFSASALQIVCWPADGALVRIRRCGALGGGRAYRLDDGAADEMALLRRGTPGLRGTSSADALRGPSSADEPRSRTARSRLRSPSAENNRAGKS